MPELARVANKYADSVGFISLLDDYQSNLEGARKIVDSVEMPESFITVDAYTEDLHPFLHVLSSGYIPTSFIFDGKMQIWKRMIGIESGVLDSYFDELLARLEQDHEQALDQTPAHDPTAMPGNQYASVLVGDIINFGGNDWIVLDIQDGRALILSEKIIAHRPYHETFEDVTWATSDTRRWLNDSYYNSFSSSDRELIAGTTLTNEDNQWFGTAGGGPTTDKIFLLSLAEVVKYFGDSGQLQNRPSEDTWYITNDGYNDARKAMCAIDNCAVCLNRSSYYWGLRSPGWLQNFAAGVSLDGRLCVDGGGVNFVRPGIRPALWLKL